VPPAPGKGGEAEGGQSERGGLGDGCGAKTLAECSVGANGQRVDTDVSKVVLVRDVERIARAVRRLDSVLAYASEQRIEQFIVEVRFVVDL
jgi:hypothetical protein